MFMLTAASAGVAALSFPPLGIDCFGKELDEIKNEIIRHIHIARSIDWEKENEESPHEFRGEYYQMYWMFNTADITEFYFPTKIIEGYELGGVSVYEDTLVFYYAPSDELNQDTEYWVNPFTTITMWIQRTGNDVASDPLKPIINQLEEQGREFLFEDNLVYEKCINAINGQIGNTRYSFRLSVPDKLNNFEFLREVCFEISDTAELVIIEDYSPKTGDSHVVVPLIVCMIALCVGARIARPRKIFL